MEKWDLTRVWTKKISPRGSFLPARQTITIFITKKGGNTPFLRTNIYQGGAPRDNPPRAGGVGAYVNKKHRNLPLYTNDTEAPLLPTNIRPNETFFLLLPPPTPNGTVQTKEIIKLSSSPPRKLFSPTNKENHPVSLAHPSLFFIRNNPPLPFNPPD